jgi:hypothetical protein
MRDQAATLLQTLHDEMETYHDDRSEDWQESDRGEEFTASIEAIGELAEAACQLDIG